MPCGAAPDPPRRDARWKGGAGRGHVGLDGDGWAWEDEQAMSKAIRFLGVGLAAVGLLVLGAAGARAESSLPDGEPIVPLMPEDESVNWIVVDSVDQDFSEGSAAPAVRATAGEAPSGVAPPSIHQSELEYYGQFEATSESDWDEVKAVRTRALPKGGASSPGPFVLNKEVFGWHPYWQGTGYTNYTFDLLSTVAYFSYDVNPSTGYATTMNSWSNTPLVEWAHSNGTKVVLCATMMSGHTNFFASSTAQSNLINELVRVIKLRNADGVNIDFEAIPSGYRTHLTTFMSNLAGAHACGDSRLGGVHLPAGRGLEQSLRRGGV